MTAPCYSFGKGTFAYLHDACGGLDVILRVEAGDKSCGNISEGAEIAAIRIKGMPGQECFCNALQCCTEALCQEVYNQMLEAGL